MTSVYMSPEIAEVLALHPYVAKGAFRTLPVREQIAQQATTLHKAHQAGDRRVRMQIMCWWPDAKGQTIDGVMTSDFSDADALLSVSREHGFPSWEDVCALDDLAPSPLFEATIETMLSGDLEKLMGCLEDAPHLAQQRSAFGHGATLLHYLGANGVETHRQRVPLNAVEIAKFLIVSGASRTSKANMYGGGQTPLSLASTSAHPFNAGIAEALNKVLS